MRTFLRDVCKLSRSEAKTLISRIKQSRDDEPNYDEIAASLLKLIKHYEVNTMTDFTEVKK